jgi:hypothetical protein
VEREGGVILLAWRVVNQERRVFPPSFVAVYFYGANWVGKVLSPVPKIISSSNVAFKLGTALSSAQYSVGLL